MQLVQVDVMLQHSRWCHLL